MPRRLVATISDTAAAKLETLRLALGQGREADALEFAIRTASPRLCQAAFAASLWDGGQATGPLPCPATALVELLADVLTQRLGRDEPSALLATVVVGLARHLAARSGRCDDPSILLIHTLTHALRQLYCARSAQAKEPR